jgi:hypothetical protein
MQLEIHGRAQIQFRYLAKSDQKRVHSALAELTAAEPGLLFQNGNLESLRAGLTTKKMYAYRVSSELGLILSLEGDKCTVEDILNYDRILRAVS